MVPHDFLEKRTSMSYIEMDYIYIRIDPSTLIDSFSG